MNFIKRAFSPSYIPPKPWLDRPSSDRGQPVIGHTRAGNEYTVRPGPDPRIVNMRRAQANENITQIRRWRTAMSR